VWFPERSPYAGQIIVERGRDRLHYFPETGEIQRSAARGEAAYNRLATMVRDGRYVTTVREDGFVAGVHTQVVTVAEAAGGVVQRLWIDPSSGMILRRVLYDSSGRNVGFFEYKAIEFNPAVKASDFTVNLKGARYVQLRDKVAEEARGAGLPAYEIAANRGYELTAVRVLGGRSRHPTLVQTYRGTEGSVSLFQTTGPINARLLAKLAGDRYQTYTWRQDGSNFALVGDPGVAELQRIAGLVGRG
jgi:hypothetical protein